MVVQRLCSRSRIYVWCLRCGDLRWSCLVAILYEGMVFQMYWWTLRCVSACIRVIMVNSWKRRRRCRCWVLGVTMITARRTSMSHGRLTLTYWCGKWTAPSLRWSTREQPTSSPSTRPLNPPRPGALTTARPWGRKMKAWCWPRPVEGQSRFCQEVKGFGETILDSWVWYPC